MRFILFLMVTITILSGCGSGGGDSSSTTANPQPPTPPTENPQDMSIPCELTLVENEIPTTATVTMQRDASNHVYWFVQWEGLRGREGRQWNDPTVPKWPWSTTWSRMLGPNGYPMRASSVTYDPITRVLAIPGYCKIKLLVGSS